MRNLSALEGATVVHDPFDYAVTGGVVTPELSPSISNDFPYIGEPGSYPISRLTYGPSFAALLDELRSPAFTAAVGRMLGCSLEGMPQLITVRGRCGPRDGSVHTDAAWKEVTVLLYLNRDWGGDGGRLRLLKSSNLEDVAVEVPPAWGTLIAFRRSDRSFHGHRPFTGERRLVQVNWLNDASMVEREERRHRLSAGLKGLVRRFWPHASDTARAGGDY